MSTNSSKIAVYGALIADIAVSITKFVAAAVTGSSSMLCEGIHSVVDSCNILFLLVGMKRSQLPANEMHPFGHGKELYFWSLVVAMSLFGIGGGISVYEGIDHILEPSHVTDAKWNYIILTVAFLFDGTSWLLAYRQVLKDTGNSNVFKAIQNSKDPAVFAVLLEDTAALVGVVIAFAGIYLSEVFHAPQIDGAASILIGIILTGTAVTLAYESKSLLIGESASAETIQDIKDITNGDHAVDKVGAVLTMHMGPREVMMALGIHFKPDLSSEEVVTAIDRIEYEIRSKYPEITKIYVESKSIYSTVDEFVV